MGEIVINEALPVLDVVRELVRENSKLKADVGRLKSSAKEWRLKEAARHSADAITLSRREHLSLQRMEVEVFHESEELRAENKRLMTELSQATLMIGGDVANYKRLMDEANARAFEYSRQLEAALHRPQEDAP